MYEAKLPPKYHLVDMIEKLWSEKIVDLKNNGKIMETESISTKMLLPSLNNEKKVQTYVCTIICKCNKHVHTHTCHKGHLGKTGCHLCYKFPICKKHMSFSL